MRTHPHPPPRKTDGIDPCDEFLFEILHVFPAALRSLFAWCPTPHKTPHPWGRGRGKKRG